MGDSDALGRAHSFIDDQDFNLDDTLFADDDDDGTDDLGNIFNDSNDSLNFSASQVAADIDPEKEDGAGDESNEKSSSDNERKPSSSSRKKKKKGGDGETSSSKQQPKKKRRRSSLSVDGSRAGPPPSWHNQAADKSHRDKMIREIAHLLKARKKTPPTNEWMQQLPHKARALEERLYKTSPSLESYLDRSTLKNRLKKVAVLITTQYKESAKGRKLSKTSRGSSSSFSIPWVGGGATTRDSVSSNMGPPRSVSVGAGGNVSQRSSFASNNGTKQNTMPVGQESAGLSKQKAVNEELQRQILANIRQQQHLVHSTRQGSSEVSRNDNNGSNEPGGLQQGSISEIGRRSSSGQMLQSNHQFSNMQQNPFNSNIQQQNGQMVNSMMGNPMNDMQGNQLTNRNMQGNMMHQMGSNSLGMGDAAFSTQTSLMRHTSAPESSSGSNFSPAQMAMMRQQSVPVPNGSNGMNMPMHMQNAATMQATFMRQQNSSDTPSSLQQQQQQQQQAALMRQMPNPQNQREAAAFAQMQATMMGQAQGASNGQFNTIGQSDAFLMRQNSGQMNPQAQGAMMRQMSESSQQFSQSGNAAMQADMMRRTSFGNNQNLLSPNGGSSFGPNSTIMNQQIGNIGTTMLPNGQVVPTHMLQSNPVLLQQMNAVNMQQNMAQNFQQPQMMNNMTIMQGQNPGNFNLNDRSNGQSNKSGDDSDFNW